MDLFYQNALTNDAIVRLAFVLSLAGKRGGVGAVHGRFILSPIIEAIWRSVESFEVERVWFSVRALRAKKNVYAYPPAQYG